MGTEVSSGFGRGSDERCVIVELPSCHEISRVTLYLMSFLFQTISVCVEGNTHHNAVRHELEMTEQIVVDVTYASHC